MKILVPTCRPAEQLEQWLSTLRASAPDCVVLASCLQASASVNRNWCLDHVAVHEVAIMLDDDIDGFYEDWVDDLLVTMQDPAVVMVSARLLTPAGTFAQTCSRCYDDSRMEVEVRSNGQCVLPTAAIVFRHRGHCFDEHYLGSGWEDSDWCMQYLASDPTAKFIQSNRCRLVHRNEQKNQGGPNWKHNQMYFFNKWKPHYAHA